MKETIFTYVYKFAIGVMLFSAVLMLFVQNVAPFGLSASWSGQGFTSSLVITRPLATAHVGSLVAKSGELVSEVLVYGVEEVVRQEGTLHYRLTDTSFASAEGGELGMVPAIELGRTVLFSVPFVGVFVEMLTHSVGVMALIGLPLLMIGINFAMLLLQRVLPTLALVEKSAQKKSKARVQVEQEPEAEAEYGMTTVLKPYKFQRKLRLQ